MDTSNRIFASTLFVLSISAAACSGTPDNVAPLDGGANADSGDGGECVTTPLAKDQDLTCATDADCTLAPPGGDPCGCSAQDTWCKTAPISVSAGAAYTALVQDAHRKYATCPTSCPAELTPPKCCAGICTLAADCHQ